MTTTGYFAGRRPQRGLSLIELLVALALGLAVLVGLSSVYVAVKQSFRFQETTGRLQEDATFAMDSIARDLRMAGSAGCMGINKVANAAPPPTNIYYPGSVLASGSPASPGITVTPDSTSGFYGPNPLGQIETTNAEVTLQPFTSLNFVRGFDNGIPTGMVAATNPTPSTISDSLLFSGASFKAVSVSAPMAAASAVPLAGDPYKWKDTAGGTNSGIYTFIISDCSNSSVFNGKVTGSGPFTIDHSGAMGNSSDSLASDLLADASVMPAEWSFYYIATRTGASTPSLYRVFFNGNKRFNAEELVSNVEAMKLNYGENTGVDAVTGAPTLVPDVWRANAAAVADWSRVVAVRIGLMMVSSEDNANPEVTLTVPTLLGQTYTAPTGASANRLRKEFSTTVVMRNRVAAR